MMRPCFSAESSVSTSNSHDVGLVHGGDLLALVVARELEGELGDARAGLLRDELDGLHHAVHDLVLDARVLALRVLADGDHVHVVVQGFYSVGRYRRFRFI